MINLASSLPLFPATQPTSPASDSSPISPEVKHHPHPFLLPLPLPYAYGYVKPLQERNVTTISVASSQSAKGSKRSVKSTCSPNLDEYSPPASPQKAKIAAKGSVFLDISQPTSQEPLPLTLPEQVAEYQKRIEKNLDAFRLFEKEKKAELEKILQKGDSSHTNLEIIPRSRLKAPEKQDQIRWFLAKTYGHKKALYLLQNTFLKGSEDFNKMCQFQEEDKKIRDEFVETLKTILQKEKMYSLDEHGFQMLVNCDYRFKVDYEALIEKMRKLAPEGREDRPLLDAIDEACSFIFFDIEND